MNQIISILIAFFIFQFTYSYTCFMFRNNFDTSEVAAGCSGYYAPSAITGWHLIKTWTDFDCAQCTKYLTLSDEMKQEIEERNRKSKDLKNPTGDPVPCCVYSDPKHYYVEPIYTEAVNPDDPSPYCDDTLYGATKIGEWDVTQLYNECYFIPNGTSKFHKF
ncbi:hypothetical protein M0811_05516 [Anaeramoeba ignava]|uniref:Uncharacterized protein n=1 Tax=Anaeramoeba ignava TaxID=1746090 RepID=A0A9Q0LQB6_ANAIG|nr:hypothetical protein M0811_05516 [Anaeramoeba ignava]